MDAAQFALICRDIDDHKAEYIERLRHAVAIPSVSADPEHRKDLVHMSNWAKTVSC